MIERISALAGEYHRGASGLIGDDGPGVVMSELRPLSLWQVNVFADAIDEVGKRLAGAVGAGSAPGPGASTTGEKGALLRLDPLKFWVAGHGANPILRLAASKGSTLDLSHARTVIRIEGRDAAALLTRFVALDLRATAFPEGAFTATGAHHMGFHIHRRAEGYDLYAARGFALSMWEMLSETARQFGLEIV